MNSRAEKERQKQIQDKCQRLLTEMLKDEDNKYCVDCDAKGPRWASWNLGIFLCIRCAGIHRKLGVHISRVKSVNLDTWTPQQVVQMGNSRARAVYEANLPDNFRRPQNEGPLENFVRAKYEHKKYIAREWVPPPLPKVNWDKELEEEAERLKKKKREVKANSVTSILPLSTPPVTPQLLPKPLSCSPKPSRISSNSQCTDLLELDTPTKETSTKSTVSDSDLFTSFLNASPDNSTCNQAVNSSPAAAAAARTEEEDDFFNQSISSAPNKQKQLTKDSILALYGNPSSNYMPAQVTSGIPQMFGVTPANGAVNAFPKQINTQSSLQKDSIGSNVQFPNASAISSSMSFASNPFYSMAASGIQANSTSQKGFPSFSSLNSAACADLQQSSALPQQMDALNLNNATINPFFSASNCFDFDGEAKSQQKNFNQSVQAANFWQ